jgi:nucleoside-diphosphate-sugar epimerase
VTVQELAKRVISLSGRDIKMSFDPSKPKGALNRTPDLSRAAKVLGWKPKTPFGEGLAKTYEWAQARLKHRPKPISKKT